MQLLGQFIQQGRGVGVGKEKKTFGLDFLLPLKHFYIIQ